MNPQTTLLRQVHPNFIPDGQLTSQAFTPFPKDNGKLSVYDGDQISAADSHKHYTEVLGYQSESVWGLTCAEVSAAGLNSMPAPVNNSPHHAVVDFSSHSDKSIRKLAKKLKACAIARGCLHPPR
jgi:hypothetical protein